MRAGNLEIKENNIISVSYYENRVDNEKVENYKFG